MATFTSSLPNDLLEQIEKIAKELKLPKNKLIEKALRLYLDQLNKAAYVKSYKELAQDTDLLQLAEEGIEEYFTKLNDLDDE